MSIGLVMDKKTKELLLINYKNIHKAILIDCAYKQKFTKLIADLEKEIEKDERTR